MDIFKDATTPFCLTYARLFVWYSPAHGKIHKDAGTLVKK